MREPEEILLVDRVQHHDGRTLDDLVLQRCDRQRALPTIRLRDIPPPARLRPIRSPLDPIVQTLDPSIEVCLVVLPCQPVHPRGGISLKFVECHPQRGHADMMEKRGEPLLLPLLCSLPYAIQRL